MYMCFEPNTIAFFSRARTNQIFSNAMVLNAVGAAIYVLIGSFRGLLNFKGNVLVTLAPIPALTVVHRDGRIHSLPRYSIWGFSAPLSKSCRRQ
jgi:hypothetical protein